MTSVIFRHITITPITASGHTITQEQVLKAVEKLRTCKAFNFADVQIALAQANVCEPARYRGADHLLSRLKRQGMIEFNRDRDKLWTWIESASSQAA